MHDSQRQAGTEIYVAPETIEAGLSGVLLQRFQQSRHQIRKLFENGYDALPGEGRPIGECYIAREVAVYLRVRRAGRADNGQCRAAESIWVMICNATEVAVFDHAGPDPHGSSGNRGERGKQSSVFVGDVEVMKSVELRALVGFDVVNDQCFDFLAGSGPFTAYSFKGAFQVDFVVPEGKCSMPIDVMFVGRNKNTEGMVERSTEIVDGVPHDRGCVLGELPPDLLDFVSGLRVDFTRDAIRVVGSVSCKKGFELIDVVVGPAYL